MEDKISILKEIAETGDAIKKIKKVIENVDFDSFDGIKGEKGEKGDTGDKGEKGDKGDRGEKGDTGQTGEPGKKGEKGDKGVGIDGVDGKDGTDGRPGKAGKDGSPDTGEQVVEKLTSLKGDKRLSYKSLKDAPTIFKDSKGGGGIKGTGYLYEISDVAIDNPQDSDGLIWDSTTKKWKNSASVNTDEKVKASATDPTPGYLNGKVAKSIVVTSDKLELSGDAATPGNSKYYGTNGAGAKGFYDIPNPDLTAYETLKKVLASKGTSYQVLLGDTGKILVDTAGITFTLPVIASGDVGTKITVVKNNAGTTTIDPNSGQSIGDDATAIYSDINEKATITLLAVSTTLWVVIASNGVWSQN